MASKSEVLTDRKKIEKWAEARGGVPSMVRGTGNGDTGILRIMFPDAGKEDSLEEISWDEFFDKFEEKDLALLVQEKTADGKTSRFNKLVSRSK
jgi:hypothetical protein